MDLSAIFDQTQYVTTCQSQKILLFHNLVIRIFIKSSLISKSAIYIHIINPDIILYLPVYMYGPTYTIDQKTSKPEAYTRRTSRCFYKC